jgi:hypothetical protein
VKPRAQVRRILDGQNLDAAQDILAVQQGHSLADRKSDQRHPQIGADGQAAAVMFGIGPVIKRPRLRPSGLDGKAYPGLAGHDARADIRGVDDLGIGHLCADQLCKPQEGVGSDGLKAPPVFVQLPIIVCPQPGADRPKRGNIAKSGQVVVLTGNEPCSVPEPVLRGVTHDDPDRAKARLTDTWLRKSRPGKGVSSCPPLPGAETASAKTRNRSGTSHYGQRSSCPGS